MQRGAHESRVRARGRKAIDVFAVAYTATRNELYVRTRVPNVLDQDAIRPGALPDTGQVQQDERVHAHSNDGAGHRGRIGVCERAWRSGNELITACVDAEHHPSRPEDADDVYELVQRRQRLETYDHTGGPCLEDRLRHPDRRDARIDHRRETHGYNRGQGVRERCATHDPVQIGYIYFPQSEPIPVGPAERDGISDLLLGQERAPHGLVRLPRTTAGVYGFSAFEIDHADDAHASNMRRD